MSPFDKYGPTPVLSCFSLGEFTMNKAYLFLVFSLLEFFKITTLGKEKKWISKKCDQLWKTTSPLFSQYFTALAVNHAVQVEIWSGNS